jgi:phage anti-repressor protein
MEYLIKYKSCKDQNPVSGKELHQVLNPTHPFGVWFKIMVNDFGFKIGVDFDYIKDADDSIEDVAMSMDMAKEICMVQRTEKGRITRMWFIEEQKKLSHIHSVAPTTTTQALLLAVQKMADIESQTMKIDNRLQKVESHPMLTGEGVRVPLFQYAGMINRHLTYEELGKIGLQLSKICRQKNIALYKTQTPGGFSNAYPIEVLKEYFGV